MRSVPLDTDAGPATEVVVVGSDQLDSHEGVQETEEAAEMPVEGVPSH